MIVHDLPRFLVNYVHAQTVDTRPTFSRGGRGLGTRLHMYTCSCTRHDCKSPTRALQEQLNAGLSSVVTSNLNGTSYSSVAFIVINCRIHVLVTQWLPLVGVLYSTFSFFFFSFWQFQTLPAKGLIHPTFLHWAVGSVTTALVDSLPHPLRCPHDQAMVRGALISVLWVLGSAEFLSELIWLSTTFLSPIFFCKPMGISATSCVSLPNCMIASTCMEYFSWGRRVLVLVDKKLIQCVLECMALYTFENCPAMYVCLKFSSSLPSLHNVCRTMLHTRGACESRASRNHC